MDLQHLHYFVTVVEEMNITRAAERLGLAQPYLTRIIRGLEDDLDAQLLDRSKRQITLTPAGKVFFERVAPMLTQYQETVQLTQQVSRGEKGKLYVGFTGSAIYSILPNIVRAYTEQFPETEVVLRDLSLLSQRARLQTLHEHRIDIGFMSSPPKEEGISREQVFESPLMVILPITHPLASQEAVALEALAEEAWIWGPRRKDLRVCNQIFRLCQQAGFEPRVVQTVKQFHVGVSLVAAGVGIMVTEAWTQTRHLMSDRVVYRDLKDVAWQVDLQMLWRANEHTPLLETFLQVARDVSAQIALTNAEYQLNTHT